MRYNGTTGAFIDNFVPSGSGGLSNPFGLTFGPDGNLYVACNCTNGVLRYNGNTGAFMGPFASGGLLSVPFDLTFGLDGNLYVTSGNPTLGNGVLRYNGTTGAFIDNFVPSGSGGLLAPRGLVFGPDGNLYVSSLLTNSILRYNGTTGAFIDAFIPSGSGGLNQPSFLRFTPRVVLSFAAFSAKLEIESASGAFHLESTFILGPGGSIDPPTQDTTLQLGGFTMKIPAGSFQQQGEGDFIFEGAIGGIALQAEISSLGGGGYSFQLEGAGASNLPTSNPVTVKLTIGNNTGSISVNASITPPRRFVFSTFDVPFATTFSPVETEGLGINTFAQIVGDYADSNANFTHGYLRDPDGRFTPIDFPFAGGVFETSPKDINVTGVIVGQYFPAGSPAQCFILQYGIFTSINFQGAGFSGTINTGCRGINNQGQIVGRYRNPFTHLRHGFLLSDGVFTTIDFPGAAETIARRINNHGKIVGGYSTDATVDLFHGFMRDEAGNFHKIDFPGSIDTFAAAINDEGVIAGLYVDSANFVHAFLFDRGVYITVPLPGVPQNLGSFTEDSANFTIGISGITDNGLITGTFMTADGNFHGFLGTPAP